MNLLNYKGDRSNYAAIGRHLSSIMLNKEQRMDHCWLMQRTDKKTRKALPKEEELLFEGIFIVEFFRYIKALFRNFNRKLN